MTVGTLIIAANADAIAHDNFVFPFISQPPLGDVVINYATNEFEIYRSSNYPISLKEVDETAKIIRHIKIIYL